MLVHVHEYVYVHTCLNFWIMYVYKKPHVHSYGEIRKHINLDTSTYSPISKVSNGTWRSSIYWISWKTQETFPGTHETTWQQTPTQNRVKNTQIEANIYRHKLLFYWTNPYEQNQTQTFIHITFHIQTRTRKHRHIQTHSANQTHQNTHKTSQMRGSTHVCHHKYSIRNFIQ